MLRKYLLPLLSFINLFLFSSLSFSQEQSLKTNPAMPTNVIGTEPISDVIGLFNIYYERKVAEKITLTGTIGTGKLLYFVDVNSAFSLTAKIFPSFEEDDFLLLYLYGSTGYLSVEYNNVENSGATYGVGIGLRVLVFDSIIAEAYGGLTFGPKDKVKYEKIDGNLKATVSTGGAGIGIGARIGIAF